MSHFPLQPTAGKLKRLARSLSEFARSFFVCSPARSRPSGLIGLAAEAPPWLRTIWKKTTATSDSEQLVSFESERGWRSSVGDAARQV